MNQPGRAFAALLGSVQGLGRRIEISHERWRWWWGGASAALVLASLPFWIGGRYQPRSPVLPASEARAAETQTEASARRQLASLVPRGVVVLIDTHANRLKVLKNEKVLHEAVCSTGSGTVLKDPDTGRIWTFDSPLGERQVQRKTREPVWIKPDWAFIEEGQRPPEDDRQRRDDISMGRYGLYLGDGFLIHGTIFQTLLGRKVTHGCVRLGDQDLETVYRLVPVGARVLFY
ncbi:MAG: L,D-transpeptidase [Acidobacteria bacterium]|nr:L,D-transpeptidase [Acidobacteriota bacterium]